MVRSISSLNLFGTQNVQGLTYGLKNVAGIKVNAEPKLNTNMAIDITSLYFKNTNDFACLETFLNSKVNNKYPLKAVEIFNEVKDKDESEFSGYTTIPDGNYNAVIDDLEATESKSGKPMFVISFRITDGEFKDQIHKQFIMLCANDEVQLSRNLNRLATTLKKLGIDNTKFALQILKGGKL